MMSAIEWNEEMSAGLNEFDADHRQIIAISNRLDVSPETGNDRKLIETTLAELSNYCLYHLFAERMLCLGAIIQDISTIRKSILFSQKKYFNFWRTCTSAMKL